MLRWSACAFLLAGGLLFALPPPVTARCYDVGTLTFRCDPIVSDSLRRQSQGLPSRYTPRSSSRYQYEGNTFTVPSTGASIHRYRYKSPSGRMYTGKIETFPGGAVRHRGRWR